MNFIYRLILFVLAIIIAGVNLSAEDDCAYFDYKIYQCTIKNNKSYLKIKIKITINNARGKEYNAINVYENKFNKIKKFRARLLDSKGNEIQSVKLKDMNKSCGFGASFQIYRDICYYYKEMAYPKYPYSIEYEYETECNSLFFWRGMQFQHYVPVNYASYELTCPADFDFEYRITGSEIKPIINENGSKKIYLWEFDSLSALEKYSYRPDGYPQKCRIGFLAKDFQFGGVTFREGNWKNIGLWYFELAVDCYLEKETQSDSPAKMKSGTIADIEAVYQDLIDTYRYVSVSIGIGGWKPNPAELTKERSYGDCKDLTTILISKLRAIGVKSFPALALTRGEGKLEMDFPSFGFNHVFTVAIMDNDTIWMDPTCGSCPFGELPSGDENVPVLIVTDTGGIIGTSPASKPEDNQIFKSTVMHINRDKTINFESELKYTGNFARYYRSKLKHFDRDEENAFMNQRLPGGDKRYIVDGYEIINKDKIFKPLVFKIAARKKKCIDEMNNTIYLNPDVFEVLKNFETLDIDKRDIPIDLGYPMYYEHKVSVTWSPSLDIDSLTVPPDDGCVYEFGSMHVRYNPTADSIGVHYDRSDLTYEIGVDRFEEFENYRSKLKEARLKHIKFYRAAE